ncbi:hypothetical protein RJ641_009509 [Dillenia turbinata]|uniref:Uncharacterized protein n=1 Tax=Dillenia turbinata TaxID=194707 RepID=A0AAN8VCL7_9MAGN
MNVTETSMSQWNSPLPYLFGGLAFILGLMAAALIILVCSRDRPSPEESNGLEEETHSSSSDPTNSTNIEPKIVVIMPGEVLKKLDPGIAEKLEEVKIKRAFWDCGCSKAPGPDEFNF